MTKSRFMTVAAVAGLVAMLMAFDASAQRGGKGRGRGMSGLGYGAAALDLSTDQKAKIEKLRSQMMKDLAPITAKLDELRRQMQKLWAADQPSEKKIMAKQREMDKYRQKIRERRMQFRLDVFAVLTDEQRKRLNEFRKARPGRGGRGGRGGGFGFDCDLGGFGCGQGRGRGRGRGDW